MDPLDDPHFNPVEYVNNMFPNEQSLVDLELAINRLKVKIKRTDYDVLREVRLQSIDGDKGKKDLQDAKNSIQELFAKINEIKRKAEQSEVMVQETCRDIKSLDYAKKHLTATITSLKRLHMLVTGVDQLEVMAKKRQYREVGNLLEAINELSTHFQNYQEIPKISHLTAKVTEIKAGLNGQIYKEFSSLDRRQPIVNPMNLADACFVVDALGPDAKDKFVSWFCERRLSDYLETFQPGMESARLEHTERRFSWLRRELSHYDEHFKNVFPNSWFVDEQLCEQFAEITRQHLSALLESSTDSLNVEVLTAAVERTQSFEKTFLAPRFASNTKQTYAAPVPNPTDGDATAAPEDDPTLNPNSAEAIKKRFRRFQQQREKKKNEEVQAVAPVSQVRFKGTISQCFGPYLTIYIRQLDKDMGLNVDRMIKAEDWDVEDEEDNKVLGSSKDMIRYFDGLMKQCHSLSSSQPFFDLYKLFRKYLSHYASTLNSRLPSTSAKGLVSPPDPTPLSDHDERIVLLIINTSEYCSNRIDQLCDKMKGLIDPAFEDSIDFSAEKDEFESLMANATRALVHALESKLMPALQNMARMPWASWHSVGDQSPYVNQICGHITNTVPLYHRWLKEIHFRFFCDSFVDSFVPRLINNIYNCRQISEIGAEQLLLDFTAIKGVLTEMPVLGERTGVVSKQHAKYVNKAMVKAEMLLKIILAPQESLLESYRALATGASEADFQKVLELKGMKKDDSFIASLKEFSLKDSFPFRKK